MRAALDDAGSTLQFSEAGVAWANHTLAPERRWPETFAAGGRLQRTTWEQLTATTKRDSTRRITLPATPATHAQLTLAARAAGVPLVVWALKHPHRRSNHRQRRHRRHHQPLPHHRRHPARPPTQHHHPNPGPGRRNQQGRRDLEELEWS